VQPRDLLHRRRLELRRRQPLHARHLHAERRLPARVDRLPVGARPARCNASGEMSPAGPDLAAPSPVTESAVEVRGRPARVFRGGRGPALLLIHGGWGGAAAHWEPVFAPLAAHFDVVAPDLPGFDDPAPAGPRSVDDYADWLVALLDALGVERAACVGNSFGASVAWSLAARHPARCDALVLVNGFPMPRTPPLLRRLGAFAAARALLARYIARDAFSLRALAAAFVDPAHVPAAVRAVLAAAHPAPLARMVDAFLLGGSEPPPPRARTLLLWGASDGLRASRAATAERLHRENAGSRLELIADAGHLPQRERPDAFVAALRQFLERRSI
jgi:pimeloyl-ACP methyl ester carboxylesterase